MKMPQSHSPGPVSSGSSQANEILLVVVFVTKTLRGTPGNLGSWLRGVVLGRLHRRFEGFRMREASGDLHSSKTLKGFRRQRKSFRKKTSIAAFFDIRANITSTTKGIVHVVGKVLKTHLSPSFFSSTKPNETGKKTVPRIGHGQGCGHGPLTDGCHQGPQMKALDWDLRCNQPTKSSGFLGEVLVLVDKKANKKKKSW